MELLNKIYWKQVEEKYPEEVKCFTKWIDQYKNDEGWNGLFKKAAGSSVGFVYPKYHDMPTAIQFGIFLQYVSASSEEEIIKLPLTTKAMQEFISHYFFRRHYNATRNRMNKTNHP